MANWWEQDQVVAAPQAAPVAMPGIITGRPKTPDPLEQARFQLSVNSDARADVTLALAKAAAERQAAAAERPTLPPGYRLSADGRTAERIPGLPDTSKPRASSNGALDAIVRQINDTTRLFNQGVGVSDGVAGLGDYFPTASNKAFDAAAAGLEDQAAMAFKVPGSGTVSDADAARIAAANKPNRFDYDEANIQRFRQLRSRVDEARRAAGLPPAQWEGVDGQDPSPMSPQVSGAAPDQFVGGFADQLPEQRAHTAQLSSDQQSAIASAVQSGRPRSEVLALMRSYGIQPSNAAEFDKAVQYYADPRNRDRAVQVEQPDNEVRSVDPGDGAAGAAVRGAANAASLGFVNRIGALADTVSGGTYADNLDRRRGYDAYDAQNNYGARLVGELAGGFALPIRGAATAGNLALHGAAYGGAAGLGNSYGSATDRLIAAGTGAALGAGLGYGGGWLSERLGNRPPPGTPTDPRADARTLLAAAQQENVRVLPADLGSSGVARQTAAVRQTPYGARVIDEAAQDSVNSFRDAVAPLGEGAVQARSAGEMVSGRFQAASDRVRAAVGDARGAVVEHDLAQDMTGAGQVAQRGARDFMERTATRADELYRRIPIEPARDASLNNTRQALTDMTQIMHSNPQLAEIFDNPRLSRLRDAITPEIDQETGEVVRQGRVSWQDLTELRTRIGDALDDPRLSEKIASRQLRQLYGALSTDMEETARSAGGAAYRGWRRANDFYDGRQKRINGTLSLLLGQRRDATANEAFANVERLARDAAGGDFANLGRVLRSLPREDAAILRNSLLARQGEKGGAFDAEQFSRDWSRISDRAKSYLLPGRGAREMMDQAAVRARDLAENPFEGLHGDAVLGRIESNLRKGGNYSQAAEAISSLSAEDASQVRATIFSRMGQNRPGGQNAGDDAFSATKFLTDWNTMSREGRDVLAGKSGEFREKLDRLALLADGMKNAQRVAGFSNTGGITEANKTNAMVIGALGSLLTGHPLVAAGFAAPAVGQAITAKVLTSPRLVSWMTRPLRTPMDKAQRLRELAQIAVREPTIANDLLPLQRALEAAIPRAAADDKEQQRR